MPGVQRADFDGGVVTRTEQVTRSVDGDHGFTAEDIEAFLEGVEVRVNGSPRHELVHAEPCVHRPRRMIDERDTAVSLAVPLECRVGFDSRFFEPAEVMNRAGCWWVVRGESLVVWCRRDYRESTNHEQL